jgi:hypothetical protein
MAASVSWTRVTSGAGTSNASTTTKGLVAAGSFTPVTSMVRVWVVLARSRAVNTATRSSSVGEYMLTSVWKTPSSKTRAMPA